MTRRAPFDLHSLMLTAIAVCILTSTALPQSPELTDLNCGWNYMDEYLATQRSCAILNICDAPEYREFFTFDSTQSIVWVRLMFHVLAEDDGSNPASTLEIVQAQMDQLNADFMQVRMQFEWDMRIVNSSDMRYWYGPTYSSCQPLRDSLYIDPDKQLNLVATEITAPIAGWSQNPGLFDPLSNFGGVILSTFSGYNLFTADLSRHSLSHEVGHCFGLSHTYVGYSGPFSCTHGCAENLATGSTNYIGDFCEDTEPEPPFGGTTFAGAGVDSCSGLPWPIRANDNFMNVSNTGKSAFTSDQKSRMYCYFETMMSSWTAGVRMDADTIYGAHPLEVQFSGITEHVVNNWSWDFGDGDSAFVESPLHIYDAPGVYTVEVAIETDQSEEFNDVNTAFVAVHADTIQLMRTEGFGGDTAEVAVYVRNYIPTSVFEIPFSFGGSFDPQFLGATVAGLRTEGAQVSTPHVDNNTNNRATLRIAANGAFFAPDTGAVAKLRFLLPEGETDSLLVEVLPYSAIVTYSPKFTTAYGQHGAEPVGGYLVRSSCCQGVRGDVNGDGSNIDISDLTCMVDYLFGSGCNQPCELEADVNGDASRNITDITFLVDYLFGESPPLVPCF